MNQYEHITKMETILNQQTHLLGQLNQILDEIESSQTDFNQLMQYYASEQRMQDIDDDDNHLIPETLHRGVLSEDGIDDLLYERRETIVRMLETTARMIKG